MAMDAHGAGIRLRPLAIGDVLDETFRVYRRQFLAFITTMAVVVVPTAVLSLPVALLAATLNEQSPSAVQAILTIVLAVPLAIVGSLARVVAGAAVVQIASDTILGRPIDVKAAYRHAFQRLGALLWSSLLIGLAVSLLAVTCIGIPFAVYLGLGWALVYPAIVLEGLGGTDGMRRSWALARDHRWRLLASTLLIGLIVLLLISIPSGLFSFAAGILIAISAASQTAMVATQVGNALFQAVGETLFGAIAYITITLLYYDLLVRKEAFDLQQRAALGGAAPPSQTPFQAGPPGFPPDQPGVASDAPPTIPPPSTIPPPPLTPPPLTPPPPAPPPPAPPDR